MLRARIDPEAKGAAILFAALGDKTRLQLVVRLSNDGPTSITGLTTGSRVSRQAITKHLRVLERAGIVHSVRVGRETKGRAGKGVTTVTGLPLPAAEIEALAAQLKKRCGSGGTVREGVIEVQGDHRDTIVAALVKLGWPAKKAGG